MHCFFIRIKWDNVFESALKTFISLKQIQGIVMAIEALRLFGENIVLLLLLYVFLSYFNSVGDKL